MPFPLSYGGNPPSNITENTTPFLDRPYDITGDWSEEEANKINEMFDMLFKQQRAASTTFLNHIAGPASSTTNDILVFSDATGKVAKDSNIGVGTVARGPGSSVTNNIVVWSSTDGLTLADSGSSIGSIGSKLKVATLTLTDSQIRNLNTTPIQIIPAPGTGLAIVPVFWFARKDTTAAGYSANPNFSIRYSGGSSDLINAVTFSMNSQNKQWAANSGAWGPVTATPANTAAVVNSTANITLGDPSNTMYFEVTYWVTAAV